MARSTVRPATTPLEAALDRVGDRWSLLLVEALLDGPRRFNELGEVVTGIAPNILSDRLRRLERGRIVVATPFQERPQRLSYALTTDGRRGRADPARHVWHAARDPLVLPDL